LSKHKTVLGWHLDTRCLTIALPKDKARIWKTSIDKVLAENGYIPIHKLKTLDGRLTHLGSIVPAARHFSSDIHHYKIMAKRANMAPHQRIKLPDWILTGTLPLWLSILDSAVQGFSMNNLVHCNPTRVHSVFGIGVVNFSTGQAWRWQLPDKLKFCLDINLLKFLGSILALLLDEGIRPMDCVLSKTDNTNTEGWLKSTNFSKTDCPAHAAIAEILGHDMIQRECCLYSQHWPGTDNTVCDVLSRDFHLNDQMLNSFLRFACPKQLPPHFHICSPSNAIVSRLSSTLRTFTAMTPSLQVPTRSALWSSKGGDFSATSLDSCPTSSLRTSNHSSASTSSEPLHTESAKAILRQIGDPTTGLCWPKLPKATSSNWQRPSSLLNGPTPDWIPMADQVPFYLANGVATRLRTDRREKAITCSVLRRMHKIASSLAKIALARLAIGAYFFAMRSCEYLHVGGLPRKTKCVTIDKIRFFDQNRMLPHSSPNLALASVVSITFVSQKTDIQCQTVTMYWSNDALLCPVRAWAAIVQSILQDLAGTRATMVNFCRIPDNSSATPTTGRPVFLTALGMIRLIRAAAHSIGAERLGFHPHKLGTHSIRSGAAMAMHLDGVPM
jgi:hypothetical protein